jgi:uncharacterized membrane protein YhiD involved in acid resistance|tara:strand:- start:400 stop:1098 length:699 start_codon:yes stop_codon:yes gene_type:complete
MNNLIDGLSTANKISHIYHPTEIILNLVLSFILGIIVSIVYKKTHKGLSYSQSFMITNIFVCVIVCMVIMIIGNSLARAFALVGALSIIRFRTVVKDTKDTAYIFWSLAAGMACGTGSYFLALAGTTILSGIAFILFFTNFGSIIKSEFIIQFRTIANNIKISSEYNKIISEYAKSSTLLHSEASGDGKTLKISLDIVMKEDKKQDELVSKISNVNGLSEVVLVAAKSDVDY